jgi:hypothetical protein
MHICHLRNSQLAASPKYKTGTDRVHDGGQTWPPRAEVVRDSAISVIFFVEAEVAL